MLEVKDYMDSFDVLRHADHAWGGSSHYPSPSEILIQIENESSLGEEMDELISVHGEYLAYCHADRHGSTDWRYVGRRIFHFARNAFPAEFLRAESPGWLADLGVGKPPHDHYPLAVLLARLCHVRSRFRKIFMHYVRTGSSDVVGQGWLEKAARNTFLLARQFSPHLLVDHGDFPYEKMAAAFGEITASPISDSNEFARQCDRSRARWSARAQSVLVKPIERVNQHAGALFGNKTESHRRACRDAAIGNSNRLGKKIHITKSSSNNLAPA
jgi:hypothetical protein